MTAACPDWATLARERESAERGPEVGAAAVDAAWRDALRHRADCEHCRAMSLQVDPLLLFSGNFAAAEDETEVTDEVDAIRRRVRLELDGRATQRRLDAARSARRRLPLASVLAAGVAAATLGLSLLLWPEAGPPADSVPNLDEALPSLAAFDGVPAGVHRGSDALPLSPRHERDLPPHIAMAPLVEPLGDEPMRVFQVPGDGLASSLDVVLVVMEVAP